MAQSRQFHRPQLAELAGRARLAAAIVLPVVYDSVGEIDRRRAALVQSIRITTGSGPQSKLMFPLPVLVRVVFAPRVAASL